MEMSDLEQRAKDAIQEIFGYTEVAPEITLDVLERLIEELSIYIEALEHDIQANNKEG